MNIIYKIFNNVQYTNQQIHYHAIFKKKCKSNTLHNDVSKNFEVFKLFFLLLFYIFAYFFLIYLFVFFLHFISNYRSDSYKIEQIMLKIYFMV